jgi:glycosyltransferase involved in cell wall biosynthesis
MPEPIAIVATVLNEAADIDVLLQSLLHQDPSPAEVIVVDGGSTDGTWERLVDAATGHAVLHPIRDESCSLRRSPGPIARGRNTAIRAAASPIVACVDAGCTYPTDWLARLTGPILDGSAEYALGGSVIDPASATLWDIASAPFYGVKLNLAQPTKSCTARSMAFRKDLWQRAGGFPETVFLGEDTVFDARVRTLVSPAYPAGAKACYHPRHTLSSSLRQLASYAATDGLLGVRPARFLRHLFRCLAEVVALGLLFFGFSALPLLFVLLLEIYFALRLDWRDLPLYALPARLLFSLLVPWVVTGNHLRSALTHRSLPNRQNVS